MNLLKFIGSDSRMDWAFSHTTLALATTKASTRAMLEAIARQEGLGRPQKERGTAPHVFATLRFHLVELGLLLGRDKSRDLRIRLRDAVGDLFGRGRPNCIDVGCRLLDQRFDLHSLLGSEREARLQARKDMTRHLGR